jgi:coenzyme F420 hydrogenase subunit beta
MTDLDAMRRALFDPEDLTSELGAFRGIYLTRSTDERLRAAAQHGGTVSTLMMLALSEGIIDTAVVANEKEDLLTEGIAVQDTRGIIESGKSRFVVSPTIGKFNETARGPSEKIGLVATPCQALALAKMRINTVADDEQIIQKLRLVVGLFCGWALSWEGLKTLISGKVGDAQIQKLDIPPSKYQCMELTTAVDTIKIPLEDVEGFVRESCRYCFDMTSEFADISVGSARSDKGWQVDKGWNQVIVRTTLGEQLIDTARSRGMLEFRDVPEANLDKLKRAALNKKIACLQKLVEKSGSPDDLLYLDKQDPVVSRWKDGTRC